MNFGELKKYRVIDISYTVIPGENPDRPFAIQKALLQDGTFRYDILRAHSHVGTHVEVASHFYEGGRSITEYPLDAFYGPGILFPIREMRVTEKVCERTIGKEIREGDIVVVRNDTGIKLSKQQLYLEDTSGLPTLTPEAAKWLADKKVKMLVLDFIRLGEDVERIRKFHDILMSKGVVFVEIVDNLDKITKPRFFVMALPYKVQGLDSSFCRAIVIEER
ncbi:cyclase family protein [Candidatus Aerophobetes bacterium]|nr:cyclase family protein [Candidatus Aerophobetes bacterium]